VLRGQFGGRGQWGARGQFAALDRGAEFGGKRLVGITWCPARGVQVGHEVSDGIGGSEAESGCFTGAVAEATGDGA
jgi:hypothetical protein